VEAALRAIRAGSYRRVDVMRTDRPEAPVALIAISAGFDRVRMEPGALRVLTPVTP
jgi:hypothetical protein